MFPARSRWKLAGPVDFWLRHFEARLRLGQGRPFFRQPDFSLLQEVLFSLLPRAVSLGLRLGLVFDLGQLAVPALRSREVVLVVGSGEGPGIYCLELRELGLPAAGGRL